ncbi:MAG: nitroreductase family protein [Lachnospiraceae bacterium]|nr:nitroreductase family protein [Lachnospiraceae bacterium]
MNELLDTIKSRKSVRTFDETPLSDQHMSDIKEYLSNSENTSNPFGIPVEFVLLDAKEHGLSSPVLSGESLYVAGKVGKKPYADVAFGYSFEKLVLHAWTLGIGTVWIGGTMKREVFETAAGVRDGEMMPCVSPLGYPSKKRSIKESMMRKGIRADSRISGDRLFFDGEWGKAYTPADDMADVFEMVRWAPSAVNKQPWRIIVKDGIYHFYEKKDKGYDNEVTGDLQKIDVGIAICHFLLGVKELGRNAKVTVSDPGIEIPEDSEYIASLTIE